MDDADQPLRRKPYRGEVSYEPDLTSSAESGDEFGRSLRVLLDAVVIFRKQPDGSFDREVLHTWRSLPERPSDIGPEDLVWISIEAAPTPASSASRDVGQLMSSVETAVSLPVSLVDLGGVVEALLSSRTFGELSLPFGATGWALPAPTTIDLNAELEAGIDLLARACSSESEVLDESARASFEQAFDTSSSPSAAREAARKVVDYFDADEVNSEDWYRRPGGYWFTLNHYAHSSESELARARGQHAQQESEAHLRRYEASGKQIVSDASGADVYGLRLDLLHFASVGDRVLLSWTAERDFALPQRLGRASQQTLLVAAQVRPVAFDSPWRLGSAMSFRGGGTDQLAEMVGLQVAAQVDAVMSRFGTRLKHRTENVLSEVSARLAAGPERREVQTRIEKETEERPRQAAIDAKAPGVSVTAEARLLPDGVLIEAVEHDLRDLEAVLYEFQEQLERIVFAEPSRWERLDNQLRGAQRALSSLLGRIERAVGHYMIVQQARLLSTVQDERTREARLTAIVGASLVLVLASVALVGQIAAIPSLSSARDLRPGSDLLWRAAAVTGLVIMVGLTASFGAVKLAERGSSARNAPRPQKPLKERVFRISIELLLLGFAFAGFLVTAIDPSYRFLGCPLPIPALVALVVFVFWRAWTSDFFNPKRDGYEGSGTI